MMISTPAGLGVVGAAACAMYAMSRRPSKPNLLPIFSHADVRHLATTYPSLCETLTTVCRALDVTETNPHVRRMILVLNGIHGEDGKHSSNASQWHISRYISELERCVEQLVASHDALKTDEAYRAVLHVREDVLPLFKSQLDSVLHNHLLARQR